MANDACQAENQWAQNQTSRKVKHICPGTREKPGKGTVEI